MHPPRDVDERPKLREDIYLYLVFLFLSFFLPPYIPEFCYIYLNKQHLTAPYHDVAELEKLAFFYTYNFLSLYIYVAYARFRQ